MKTRPHLNITYLSERLQEALCDIFQYSVTTVTAPYGYGKTTAVSAFLKQAENDCVSVRRQSIYGTAPPPSGKVSAGFFQEPPFIRSWQLSFFPQMRTQMPSFSSFWSRPLKKIDLPFICLIDDLHLLTDLSVFALLFALGRLALPEFHLILASRNPIFSPSEKLRLGKNLLEIDAVTLSPSARRAEKLLLALRLEAGCRLPLKPPSAHGRLVFLRLSEPDSLPRGRHFIEDSASIYDMIFHILLDPLPSDYRKLL